LTEPIAPETEADKSLESSDSSVVEEKALSPLLAQYAQLKSQNPSAILLFRCGDFYETFFEDAVVAARELQITLTARGKHSGNPVPLAGVPYHSAMNYIAKLVNKGFTVAICEQMEDPKLAKGLVKREIVRILTPGTITDPQLLEEKTNNYLVAFATRSERFCLAGVELSTGEVITASGDKHEMSMLREEFTRLNPRELLTLSADDDVLSGQKPPWDGMKIETHSVKITDSTAVDALCGIYPKEPKSRFLALPSLELKTLGILADYLLDTQKCSLAHLKFPMPYKLGDGMVLDESTLRNLELLPDNRERAVGGTLFEVVNRTMTAMGARLLKRWLLKPLIQVDAIVSRQNLVTAFFDNTLFLAEIREILKGFPDLERLLSKTVLGGRNPRDLQALGNGLARLPNLHKLISASSLASLASQIEPLPELSELLEKNLRENLPMNLADGGVIADGVDPALDELRTLRRDGDAWLQKYEEKERDESGIRTLKVKKNSVFGYFIEISKSLTDKAPAHYVRKQTLVNGERFITAELKDYESKVFSATDKSIAIEKELFEKLVEKVRDHIRIIQKVAEGVSLIDAISGLAQLAHERSYVKPQIVAEPVIEIHGGRHPVVENFIGSGEFNPNDADLSLEKKHAIITGPNMAGKSTYLRQVALIALLAQIGAYVPADNAKIGVVDRIFTRIGASDNLIRGQSTFMVEMMEASAILRNATSQSLLILDEIGRGTSTFDGLALAWAILEHIHEHLGSRTLFATHYHELTDLVPVHTRLFNLNVGVLHDEKTGEMVFLHKIREGPANKSYGIEVARLAGVPEKVIDRAKEILFELEKTEQDEVGRVTRSPKNRKVPQQLSLFSNYNELTETVKKIDVNNITPVEALNILVRLKDMADG